MPMLTTLALGAALAATPAVATPAYALPTAASTIAEPPQRDDYPTNTRSKGVFFVDSGKLLPGLTCFVFYEDRVEVGERSGRRIDVMIELGPQSTWDWMLSGALRTDSEGTQYVRAQAVVNGKPAEVAVYGEGAIFECENGYQVFSGRQQGEFTYDTKNPGEPWKGATE